MIDQANGNGFTPYDFGTRHHNLEKDHRTHKPREGELVSKSKQTFKTRVKQTSFLRIISQTFDKSIFNQSPFKQNPLIKFFLQRDIFFNLQ